MVANLYHGMEMLFNLMGDAKVFFFTRAVTNRDRVRFVGIQPALARDGGLMGGA